MSLSSRDIFPEDELVWLGLQATEETMNVMIEKKIHLYNIKKDPDAFISNYDLVENNFSADAVFGENLQKQGMWDATINHVDFV